MGKYTAIDDPSAHFQSVLWTGNATARNITNDGNSNLQPDFIWMKCRDSNTSHIWQLSNLGVTKYFRSNVTSEIGTASSLISSFNTNGFGITNNSSNNVDTEKNVAWQWKANGNSTSSNTDGDITSTIQTNSTAGFTMGTYTGNGSDNQTIGHGLGAAPDWIIVKRKDTAAAWLVWHRAQSVNHVLRLPHTAAESDSASGRVSGRTSNNRGTSSIFTVYQGSSAYDNCNINGDTYCFWAWKEVQGYSRFGKYTGTLGADGPFVWCGFKPAFVMTKNITNAGYDWTVNDHKINPFNEVDHWLWPNSTGPEYDGAGISLDIDFLSNGFKIRSTRAEINNTATYVFMAFAENPFVTSTGIMGTAR